MLQFKELLAVCIEALDKFNFDCQSVEDYIKSYLKSKKDLDDDDHTFIVEVFSGCIQYSKILKVVVQGFYATDGRNFSSSDAQLFSVLCYMIIFRLDELGISHFSKFVNSQNMLKMHRFLSFFMNEENLNFWIHDEWCKQYDKRFVEEEIMKPILRWKQELDNVVLNLEDKVSNRISKKLVRKPPTRPRSFNLTRPKPKTIPLPERIPKSSAHKPVPASAFREPPEVESLKKAKEENQRKAEQMLLDANEDQFLCARSEKSLKTQIRLQNIVDQENQKLNFNMKHSRPSEYKVDSKPVKLNAAAVLREGALFQKKEQEELQRLEKLLRGERDGSDFNQWQTEMRQRDLEEKLVGVEERRVKGKLSREEAILARQNDVIEKQELASKFRLEKAQMMQEYLAMRLDEETQMRNLVENITMGYQDTQEAKVQMQEHNRRVAKEVNDENRQLMRRALEEAEEELKRKSAIIQEIRAIESVPINRGKLVDLTCTGGHELLSEMSIAELRERLSLLKESRKRELDTKKDSILKEKQAKNEVIMENLARISVYRNEMNKASKRSADDRHRHRKMQEEKVKQDERVRTLQEKLQQKKEERIKRAKELHVQPNIKTSARTQGLIRDKKRLETKRWLQIEQGYQRQAEEKLRNISSKSSSRASEGKFQIGATLKTF